MAPVWGSVSRGDRHHATSASAPSTVVPTPLLASSLSSLSVPRRRSRRTVAGSRPVRYTTSLTARRSDRSRSIGPPPRPRHPPPPAPLGPFPPKRPRSRPTLRRCAALGPAGPGPALAGAPAPPSAGHLAPGPDPPAPAAFPTGIPSSLILSIAANPPRPFTREKQPRPTEIGHLRSTGVQYPSRRLPHFTKRSPEPDLTHPLAPHALTENGFRPDEIRRVRFASGRVAPMQLKGALAVAVVDEQGRQVSGQDVRNTKAVLFWLVARSQVRTSTSASWPPPLTRPTGA